MAVKRFHVPSGPEDWPYPRHGRPWEPADYAGLVTLFCAGSDLDTIARHIGRKRDATLARLDELRLVARVATTSQFNFAYELRPANSVLKLANAVLTKYDYSELDTVSPAACNDLGNIPVQTQTQEQTMSAPTIETKTFIAGIDAKDLSDDDIFKKIAQLENQCEALAKIQNRPKKLVAKIEGLRADIQKLVEFVDSRP